MNTEDKIKRALIQIQRQNSFFAYLSLYLKFKEENNLPMKTISVDVKGNIFYDKEFIDKLSGEKIKGVICHEILHLALMHLQRTKDREPELSNICQDICVNSILTTNGFELPEGGAIPDYSNTITYMGVEINNCDKKVWESIYDEIKESLGKGRNQKIDNSEGKEESEGNSENSQENSKSNQGNNSKISEVKGDKKNGSNLNKEIKESNKGFDNHIKDNLSEKEKRKSQKEWNGRMREALTISKMKGDTPLGMELLIGKLHQEVIDWKSLLNKFIMNELPYNYSYKRPSKKSIACGEYMPCVEKEKIDITIGIDLSGSVGQRELEDFISEIVGMARAFQERINMKLITHDYEVQDEYEVRNGSVEKIKKLKLHGGGGTSHKPVFDKIKEKYNQTKCAIFLTDGYSDLDEIDFKQYNFKKLFVITNNSKENFKFGDEVIELK